MFLADKGFQGAARLASVGPGHGASLAWPNQEGRSRWLEVSPNLPTWWPVDFREADEDCRLQEKSRVTRILVREVSSYHIKEQHLPWEEHTWALPHRNFKSGTLSPKEGENPHRPLSSGG